ncbi:MAG: sodium/proline symporter PutP [Clostridia bacterium]|nr:sodium/proline symporter PutP [Clostridia bacterium]
MKAVVCLNTELVVFIVYLCFMLGIGVYFFIRSRGSGEKEYFLGGRKMGPWVSALSAGASDMSAWVLMGLPASIYAVGIGEAWIAIGLAIGYALSWIFEAPRLRRFSIAADDSITLPQYLTNRFKSSSKVLQIICAVIFLVAYTLYAASSVKACGTLFNTVVGIDAKLAMYIAAAIIVCYTFLGGFSAVCWTDFFQGLLMLGALLIAPIFALGLISGGQGAMTMEQLPEGYWNFFPSWQSVASGLGWGLGYFGMPHIIIRFMSVRSDRDLKKSARIGISWNVLIILFSVAAGCIGHLFMGELSDSSTVFIQMVRRIFPSLISGVLLSAILAASMSTADSQLLCASSAFSSDVYKPVIRKNKTSDREMYWAGRIVVLVIAVAAVLIASDPNSESIMGLVSNAWGIFGAAFGPAILLSLFWKRFTFKGAIAGITVGAVVDILWLIYLSGTGLYEIIPGFLAGLLAAVAVALLDKAPSAEVEALFDQASAPEQEEEKTPIS